MAGYLNFYPFVIVQREYLGSKMEEAQLAEQILGGFYRSMDLHKDITKLRRMPNAVVFQNQLLYNLTAKPFALFAAIDEGSLTLSRKGENWQLEYRYSLRHSLFIALVLSIFVSLGVQSIWLFQLISPLLLGLAFLPAMLRQRKWFKETLKQQVRSR